MAKIRRASLRLNEKEIGHLRGPNGRRLCRFCKKEVQPPRKTFCSSGCLHEWKIRSDTKYMRKLVYERDLGICAMCGVDTRYIRIEIENAARDAMRSSGRWHCDDHPDYLKVLNKFHLTVKEAKKSIWAADHIIPVIEGGGLCDLGNIRSLCLPCHKLVTKQLSKRRRKRRKQ